MLGNLRWIVATAVLALACLGSGLGWLRSEWTAAAELAAAERACKVRVDARDVEWTHRIAEQNVRAEAEAARDRAQSLDAIERARLATPHSDETARAASLEAVLAADPDRDAIAFPKVLARELNR